MKKQIVKEENSILFTDKAKIIGKNTLYNTIPAEDAKNIGIKKDSILRIKIWLVFTEGEEGVDV